MILSAGAMASLRFAPPTEELFVIPHAAALRAPGDRHTQVAAFDDDGLVWIGALGEDLLSISQAAARSTARSDCASRLLQGSRLWEIVRPGALLTTGSPRPMSTVYDGSDLRPWVVLGETASGELVAAPLNDDQTNPKWWTPVIAQGDMRFIGNIKNGQVELAHLWSLPSSLGAEGSVLPAGRTGVQDSIRNYFGL